MSSDRGAMRLWPRDIITPAAAPVHRNDDYDETGFETLVRMQREHFWYRGRHKFVIEALRRAVPGLERSSRMEAIDLGGGCGGWLEYLHNSEPRMFDVLALGDSSLRALELAASVVGGFADRYHVDLLDLPWEEHWDCIFMLDVLEHVPDDLEVLRQVRAALKPGGLLVLTMPALSVFWSYNDVAAHHYRRYSERDLRRLSASVGMELISTAYFMFLLSPLLVGSRWLRRPDRSLSAEEIKEFVAREHRIPSAPINRFLEKLFSLEAPVSRYLRFPWGTSVFAILRR